MNLDKITKRSIVRAIIDDIPFVDYSVKIAEIALNDRLPKLDPRVRAIWNDNALRGFIAVSYDADAYKHLPFADVPLSDAAKEKIKSLLKASTTQNNERWAMQNKLTAMFSNVRTAKQFLKLFPEFKQYLPSEPVQGVSFPLATNLIAEMMRMGWPKEQRA